MTGIVGSLRLPRKPQGTTPNGFGVTTRRDRWWTTPFAQGVLFTICAVYLGFSGVIWQPIGGPPYEVDGYLSPLFSPCPSSADSRSTSAMEARSAAATWSPCTCASSR